MRYGTSSSGGVISILGIVRVACDRTRVESGRLYTDDQCIGGVSKVLACQKPMTFSEKNIHSRGGISCYVDTIFRILPLPVVCYP